MFVTALVKDAPLFNAPTTTEPALAFRSTLLLASEPTTWLITAFVSLVIVKAEDVKSLTP